MAIELIQAIHTAETEAEQIRKEGVQKAKAELAQASAQAASIMERAEEQADAQRTQVRQQAGQEAQQAYDAALEKAQEECVAIVRDAQKNMERAVAIILGRIVKSDGNC